MTTCEKCAGGGLVGQGDSPWLRQGNVSVCTVCNGTGNISDTVAAVTSSETPSIETPVVSTDTEDPKKNDQEPNEQSGQE